MGRCNNLILLLALLALGTLFTLAEASGIEGSSYAPKHIATEQHHRQLEDSEEESEEEIEFSDGDDDDDEFEFGSDDDVEDEVPTKVWNVTTSNALVIEGLNPSLLPAKGSPVLQKCPKDKPIPGLSRCEENLVCQYGQETCCGENFPTSVSAFGSSLSAVSTQISNNGLTVLAIFRLANVLMVYFNVTTFKTVLAENVRTIAQPRSQSTDPLVIGQLHKRVPTNQLSAVDEATTVCLCNVSINSGIALSNFFPNLTARRALKNRRHWTLPSRRQLQQPPPARQPP